jgi:hypothetical protein
MTQIKEDALAQVAVLETDFVRGLGGGGTNSNLFSISNLRTRLNTGVQILDSHWQFDGATLTALTDNNTVINAYAGKNITIEGVKFDGSIVGVGVDDTTQGKVYLYGDNATDGGYLRLYNGASDDSTVEHWQFQPDGTKFNFGPNTDASTFVFDSETPYLQIQNNVAGSNPQLRLKNDAQEWIVRNYGTLEDKFIVRDVTNDTIPLLIETSAPSNSFYIDSSGQVGLGKTPSSALDINLSTEDLEIVDAGSAAATEQDWIEVEVGGNTGYIRVYAAK